MRQILKLNEDFVVTQTTEVGQTLFVITLIILINCYDHFDTILEIEPFCCQCMKNVLCSL